MVGTCKNKHPSVDLTSIETSQVDDITKERLIINLQVIRSKLRGSKA